MDEVVSYFKEILAVKSLRELEVSLGLYRGYLSTAEDAELKSAASYWSGAVKAEFEVMKSRAASCGADQTQAKDTNNEHRCA